METEFMDFGKEIFPYLLENSYRLYGFNEDYYWLDVGNPLTYLWANWDILREYGWPILPEGSDSDNDKKWVAEQPILPDSSQIRERVCLGKNVYIGENVRINPLTVIGDNTQIGHNTIIDRSVIWENVSIGLNCKINQSVIANGCKIGNNVIIRSESILGPNVIVEDGVILDSRTVQSKKVVKKEE
jgi:NDP-sugar pyrophosphorylase family protein